MFPLLPRWHSYSGLFLDKFSAYYHRYMWLRTHETTNVLSKSFAVVITIDPAQLPEGRSADKAKDALQIALESHPTLANYCTFLYFRSHPIVVADKMCLFFPATLSDEEVKAQLFWVLAMLNHEILKATKGGGSP
ncbi:hypothetical protein niasHT_035213 [Heterodera trifolii]|uniref:Uncharacterized protein n=1 Tax=Heterodera trifolii TaxID=157864 RepID=A0ABD2IME3_9BILA